MSAQPSVSGVEDLERERYASMTEKRFDDLETNCHPQLRYTHSNGVTDTLESYLEKLRSGEIVYHEISYAVEEIVVNGDVGLVLGTFTASVTAFGGPKQLDSSYLAVWKHDEAWRLLAVQSSARH